MSKKEAEAVDALTQTQEIYTYAPEPQVSPKRPKGADSGGDACDEVSFAADPENGSVVIQSGCVAAEKASEAVGEDKAEAAAPASLDTEKDVAQRLVEAAEERNLESLCEAIRRAMLAGVNPDLIEWAHGKREVLEEQCWNLNMHRAAEQALQEAMRGSSTEFLQSAVERAESIALTGELFNKARDELNKRKVRQDAEEGLYAALHGVAHGTPTTGLADAIERARVLGVSAELVSHAQRRLTELQEYTSSQKAKVHQEQKLLDLVKSSEDVTALSAELESAKDTGASLKIIDSARKKKNELEEQVWQRDLAECRPEVGRGQSEAKFAGSYKDEPAASGYTTPASTVNIPGEVHQEELLKLMRMPTRTLDAEDAPSPIQRVDPISSIEHDDIPSMQASQTRSARSLDVADAAIEPASEPTVCAPEVSVDLTPRRTQTNQLDEVVSNITTTPRVQNNTSLVEDHPLRSSLVEAPRSSWRPSVQADDAPPIYGLDAELKAKAEANYDTAAEYEASQWVQDITGVQVVGEFGEALRTGQVLCQLVNCIKPGTIAKINNAGMPFKERENITKFLKVCRTWGVHEYALFSTDDLYDEKNLLSVVKCLHQLGGVVQRAVPDFEGPHLGIADTSKAKRDKKRDFEPVSQTGGLHAAMCRSHVDVISTGNVKNPARGGC